jgi:hypothetical protein
VIKVGILGSGYGLYGYLPAIQDLNCEVVTLKRYLNSEVGSRKIVAERLTRCMLVESENSVTSRSEVLVIARTPIAQASQIQSLETSSKLNHLFLEKPVASDISSHSNILTRLRNLDLTFSVGYLFPYTNWGEQIRSELIHETCSIEIRWQMRRPSGAWKLNVDLGGGIFDYYLIHFIPLFFGVCQIESILIDSYIPSEKMRVSFILNSGQNLTVLFSFSLDSCFEIEFKRGKDTIGSRSKTLLASPFSESSFKYGEDPRVPYIGKYLSHHLFSQDGRWDNVKNSALALEEEVIRIRSMVREAISGEVTLGF